MMHASERYAKVLLGTVGVVAGMELGALGLMTYTIIKSCNTKNNVEIPIKDSLDTKVQTSPINEPTEKIISNYRTFNYIDYFNKTHE